MSHHPIIINNISLIINQKICFEKFSTHIESGKHIVIMGNNGTGKSTLLKIIQGLLQPTLGIIKIPEEIIFGSVPQTITDYPQLSGGQKFNKVLSHALSLNPDILCLDEPTNHLDLKNKLSLIRMLQKYKNTLIIVSHDPQILTLNFNEIWHIEHKHITIFHGNYSEYLKEHEVQQRTSEQERELLRKEKRQLKKLVQQENIRASRSRKANKNETDRILLGAMKESGSHTAGKNIKKLSKAQNEIQEKLSKNFIHKKIEPKFNLNTNKMLPAQSIISITNGSCGYTKTPIIHNIHLQVKFSDKVAIVGNNGTGKSTFLKALLHNPNIITNGDWIIPEKKNIGYLDQHYSNLDPRLTVTEIIQQTAPNWDDLKIRKHLNDFLFITQEEVNNTAEHLSGGEKARLSLAQIAAQSPYLLLLDEITNNVDLETREHIIEILKRYPGTLIVISHDPDFLQELKINTIYEIKDSMLTIQR